MGKAEVAQRKEETMPLISVIMGVYNSDPEKLKAAVESVLTQSVSDIELIICNDGSDNGTDKVLEGISDNRLKIITFTENRGLAMALNACIEAATGKYIARQDDDDLSLDGRFEKESDYLEKNPDIAFVGTACELYSETDGVYGEWIMPESIDKNSFLFNSPFIHGSVMFRSMVLKRHKYRKLGNNYKYEDYDLFMRLCSYGYKSANLREKLYRFHYDKATRGVSGSMRYDEYKVRMDGFKKLGLMPRGFFYAIKPLILGIIPNKAIIKIKEKTKKL